MNNRMTVADAIKLLKESSARKLEVGEWLPIVADALAKFNTLGFNVKKSEFNFGLFESTSVLGQCALLTDHHNGIFIHEIKLNEYLFREGLEDLIINNMYHELCHFLVHRDMIQNKWVEIDPTTKKTIDNRTPEQRRSTTGDNEGHGEAWLYYADLVNSKLNPAIKITAHPETAVFEHYINSNEDEVQFVIYCEGCHQEIRMLEYDFETDKIPAGLMSDIIHGQDTGHKNNYCKQCHGNLKVNFIKPDAKQKIIEADGQWMLNYLMKHHEIIS